MTVLRFPIALAAAAAALSLAGAAHAQLDPLNEPMPRTLDQRSDARLDRMERTVREMQSILNQGRNTGRPVIVQPAETPGQLQAMGQRIEDLEETLRRVNGQLDNLASEMSGMRRDWNEASSQARANNAALTQTNARLERLERQFDALTAAAVQATRGPASTGDAATDLDAAMDLFAQGQYRPAAAAFQRFLDTHGDSEEAQEASYYLGESRFRQREFEGASLAYINAIRGWPTTSWAPDATVKLAQSLVEQRNTADACKILNDFNTRYPRASAGLKQTAATTRTRARCA